MIKGFWKKQFEEHKFYMGFICGILLVFLMIFLSITIALVAQVFTDEELTQWQKETTEETFQKSCYDVRNGTLYSIWIYASLECEDLNLMNDFELTKIFIEETTETGADLIINQAGRNDSGSFNEPTIYSDCQVFKEENPDIKINCNTSETGADLIIDDKDWCFLTIGYYGVVIINCPNSHLHANVRDRK